ncbi:hypothetical protein Cgig2_002835 [Carnegiea gigantea]|uniref:Uncharacterized protein n=1 Tax=Carnegiea gigantea TaxID=171969 RepID=A0A9Q1KPT8_9CARY|nr:hypothetical protein Cgig2_002835 [Carnegiea gigantea]
MHQGSHLKAMEPITSHPKHDQLITIAINSSTTATFDHHNPHHHCPSIVNRSIIPILARFHAGYFRISLSLGSQALLWKSLIQPTSHDTLNPQVHHIFHRLYPLAFISFWSFSLLNLVILSLLYILRCIFLPHMVRAEFRDHVGMNYLFAPWISWLLLLQCAPGIRHGVALYLGLWWILVLPMVILDLKIYGRWFTTKGDKHTLTMVANPTCQMTIIGNLVGSRAAAQMGCKETAMFMFSLGMVHYLVLLVTLYQSKDTLPAALKPVFFLFFAAPAVGRASLFKKAMRTFNVTWWAYPFPITLLALAATEYAQQAKCRVADALVLVLVSLSLLVTFVMAIFTVFKYSRSLLHRDDDDDDDDDCDYDPGFMWEHSTNCSTQETGHQQSKN